MKQFKYFYRFCYVIFFLFQFYLCGNAQTKDFRLIFEHDFNVDTVIVYCGQDTFYNKVISTDHRIGKADRIDIRLYKNKSFCISINGINKSIMIKKTNYFGIRFTKRKISIERYKRKPYYI